MSEVLHLEAVRVRLLRSLAYYEHMRRGDMAKRSRDREAEVVDIMTGLAVSGDDSLYPTHVPLWENDWGEDAEHMDLAVKEARALGQIDYEPPQNFGHIFIGPFVRITPTGLHWLRTTGNLPDLADGSPMFPVPPPTPLPGGAE